MYILVILKAIMNGLIMTWKVINLMMSNVNFGYFNRLNGVKITNLIAFHMENKDLMSLFFYYLLLCLVSVDLHNSMPLLLF